MWQWFKWRELSLLPAQFFNGPLPLIPEFCWSDCMQDCKVDSITPPAKKVVDFIKVLLSIFILD